MEDDESFSTQAITSFLKKNLLVLALVFCGLILLSIGLYQSFFTHQETILLPENNTSSDEKDALQLMVDVSGAVQKPGVYALTANSRVQDALIKAGGFSSMADREYIAKTINLAQVVSDGMKIYIPPLGDIIKAGEVSGANIGKININTASSTELDSLAGVGPVTVDKIISQRPYSSIDELLTKKSVTNSVFEKIKERVSVY